MKSWKNERCRRQKLFIKTKERRQFAKDMKFYSDIIISSWRSSMIGQINAIKELRNESKSD